MIERRGGRADIGPRGAPTETVKAGLGEINEMGGTIKDLALRWSTFVFFFPHRRKRARGNLCWKYGETAIGH